MHVSEIVASPNLCLLPVQQSFIEHQCILNKDNYAFLTINTGFQDLFNINKIRSKTVKKLLRTMWYDSITFIVSVWKIEISV